MYLAVRSHTPKQFYVPKTSKAFKIVTHIHSTAQQNVDIKQNVESKTGSLTSADALKNKSSSGLTGY